VPQELRDRPQWVVWRFALNKDGTAWTKVPFQARRPNYGASSTDPATWATFEEAEAAFYRLRNRDGDDRLDGIGFVFAADDPYIGIDLDHSTRNGGIKEWAMEILDSLRSYTETSPSGGGCKVIVKGTSPESGGRKKNGLDDDGGAIEIYSRDRFFTITGARLARWDKSIGERTEQVAALFARFFPPKSDPKPKPAAAPPGPMSASDEEILDRARKAKNGAAFEALFRGDTSGHDNDDSAADLALCSYLAFWCGGDTDAIDRLFRRSGLYREKWDRADYRERTINKALEGTEFYDPHYRTNGATAHRPHDVVSGQSGEDGIGPPAASAATATQTERFALTDLGNAERLIARYGPDLRFCHPWRKWIVWDGRRWAIDRTGAARCRMRHTVRAIAAEAAAEDNDHRRKDLMRWAIDSEKKDRIAAALHLAEAESGVPILPEQLNPDRWLLNCVNGTVDLRSGRLRPHRREDLITQLCPVVFDPDAMCPLWSSTLELFLGGNAELIDFFERLFGYSLVGVIRDQLLAVCYGTGANGKSTLLGALLEVLGPDYAMKAAPDMFMAKKHESHPTDRADLFGKRLVVAIETESGHRLNEVLIKELTGGDAIRARRMREDYWQFDPTHTLIMATNHRPVIRGTDNGIWRRLKLIPFTVSVSDERADKTVPERLRAEYPGILAWCVRGCLEWQARGLATPSEVVEATDGYRREQDLIGSFLAECTRSDPSFRTRASVLYARYKAWGEAGSEFIATQTAFALALQERGFQKHISNGKWYLGIGLVDSGGDPTF
jgi:putative DNA primase/helicase